MALKKFRNNNVKFGCLKFAAILLLLVFWGCKSTPPDGSPTPSGKPLAKPKPYKVLGKWYQPLGNAHNFTQRGIASWYGKKFHGRKTSNGETYDMYAISAAHKTLPLGTIVNVHNLKNQKEIRVRINDRGPFVRGRIIDLSYGAATALGIVGSGTAPVEIVALGSKSHKSDRGAARDELVALDYQHGNFTFQVAAFKDQRNARRLKEKLGAKYKNAHIIPYESPDGLFYRVRVGKFNSLEQAKLQETILANDGFLQPMLVAEE